MAAFKFNCKGVIAFQFYKAIGKKIQIGLCEKFFYSLIKTKNTTEFGVINER